MWKAAQTHSLIGSDGVQERFVVVVANLRQNVRQIATVDHKLGIHEALKVKQVSYDVDRWEYKRNGQHSILCKPLNFINLFNFKKFFAQK